MFSKHDDTGKLIRHEVLLECPPGMTKQSHKKECDINQIMSSYKKTGTINFRDMREGEYLDVPEMDFHSALNAVKAAEEMFADMPSHLRKEFKNSPGLFMDFIHDPDQYDRSIELGLREAPEGWIEPSKRPSEPPAQPAEPPPEPAP